MISWLKYVPHSLLIIHLAKGWEIVDELHGVGHGDFAVLCRYAHEGEPA